MILPLIFAAGAGTLELSDRVGADARLSSAAQSNSYDAVTVPTARATLRERLWALSATYSPSFIEQATDISPPLPYVLQVETLGATLQSRHATVVLTEAGSFGWQNTANLVPQLAVAGQPQTIQNIPTQITTIQTESLFTTLSGQFRPTRRWTLVLSSGYSLSGGAREVDREISPLTFQVPVTVTANYALSRVDRALVYVNGARSWTKLGPCLVATTPGAASASLPATCAPDGYFGGVSVGGQHAFSRGEFGLMSVGYGMSGERISPGLPYVLSTFPLANVSYWVEFGMEKTRTTLRFDGQAMPVMDMRSGALNYGVQGTGTLRVLFRSRAMVALAAGAMQSFASADERPTSTLFVTGTSEFPIGKYVSLNAMSSYFSQLQEGAPAVSSVSFFVGAIVRSLPFHFQI